MQRKIRTVELESWKKFHSVFKSQTVSELLGRTQSFTDTRTAGPSDETLSVPLEGTAQGHGLFI